MANPREGVPYSIHVSMGCKRKDISTLCRRDVRAVFLKSSPDVPNSAPPTAVRSTRTVPPALRPNEEERSRVLALSPHPGAIEETVLDALTHVMGTQVAGPLQIGNGPGDFEHPIVCPGRKRQAGHGLSKNPSGRIVQ